MSADDLDDRYIARYATRVPNSAEVLMRADFDRARDLRDAALRSADAERMRELMGQAEAIVHRWADRDDDLGEATWEHLTQTCVDWIREPKQMRESYERLRMAQYVGTSPLTPIEWRNVEHARELTGHGRWTTELVRESADRDMPGEATPGMSNRSDTTTAYEGAEPMTDTTPTHTAGLEAESPTEIRMRADFVYAQSLVTRDPDDYDPADAVERAEIVGPWLEREDEWFDHWTYLQQAADRWQRDPQAAAKLAELTETSGYASQIELRSEAQARHLAEHGIERDETGLITSPYVTRYREQRVTEPSPLASYRPGAALAMGSDREGAER
ncbi:hypothetical protein [Nocardia farcinica]|uniref:hypothetical protein n=1 Tax=Nocardia farcinica TaxID=37329 RepID=UPI002454CF9E|nr:hypothetical protein [Nocardia farcinica]